MKFNRLITLLVVFSLIVPMVSAGNIEQCGVASNPLDSATRTAYIITQGETDYHTYSVSPGTSTLSVDLNWFTDDYSLTLSIYRPDGSRYGYYHDLDDGGYADGRITLRINNPASGSWTCAVYGEDVTGTQPYVIDMR